MKHLFRFLGQPSSDDSKRWIIDQSEIMHIQKVLRLKSGEHVEIFDGTGQIATGQLEVESKECFVNIENITKHKKQTATVELWVGALKPSSLDDLIPGLVEVGVDVIVVFGQKGGDSGRINDKVLDRWQRIILSATKQSKRPFLCEIYSYDSLDKALTDRLQSTNQLFVLDPQAQISITQTTLSPGTAVLVVGSEKGLNADELRRLDERKAVKLNAGAAILRATTACLVSSAILSLGRVCDPA
jgi:16S rRNA (uracil1498-N3)-methyltransferase